MMRIAVAGGGHFAHLLVMHISQTPNSLIVLSRIDRTNEFREFGCQVVVVDYHDPSSLRYALRGVDLVISTIPGDAQLALIEASRRGSVRRFVPSEFEGTLASRSLDGGGGSSGGGSSSSGSSIDPLDFRGSAAALDLLRHLAGAGGHMQYTIFTCGVFYERFGPAGLAAYGMGGNLGVSFPGDYLIDMGAGTADVVDRNAEGKQVVICMTAMNDVARFVAAAVDAAAVDGIRRWPLEFRFMGDSMTVEELIDACNGVRQAPLIVRYRQYHELEAHLVHFTSEQDLQDWNHTQRLIATANGRYSFKPNLENVDGLRPVDFRTWMQYQWQA